MEPCAVGGYRRLCFFEHVFENTLLIQRINKLKRGDDVLRLHAAPENAGYALPLRAERVWNPDRLGHGSVL